MSEKWGLGDGTGALNGFLVQASLTLYFSRLYHIASISSIEATVQSVSAFTRKALINSWIIQRLNIDPSAG